MMNELLTTTACLSCLIFCAFAMQRNQRISSSTCIGHSSKINGKEYKLFNKKAQYDLAKVHCKSWGLMHGSSNARLATIPNKETQQCLKNMIGSPGNYQAQDWINTTPFMKGYFVGGSDLHREQTWKWEVGTHISTRHGGRGYQNWGPYEPNNANEEDCISLLINPVRSYQGYGVAKWVDVSCQSTLFYICERDLPIPSHRNLMNQRQTTINRPRRDGSCELRSPINIDINEDEACTGFDNTVGRIEWGSDSDNVRWHIRNTGSQIQIRTQPEKSTYVKFKGNPGKFYIHYAAIKFGRNRNTGSEHTINGEHYAGEVGIHRLYPQISRSTRAVIKRSGRSLRFSEGVTSSFSSRLIHQKLQIICHPLQPRGDIHALSFMIQERLFQANSHWTPFIHRVAVVPESGLSTDMAAPAAHFKHLLGDSRRGYRRTEKDYHTNAGIRYRGTLTNSPCTPNVIWTVYPRALSLSTAQFAPLRHVHTASGELMSELTTPLRIGNPQCRILF